MMVARAFRVCVCVHLPPLARSLVRASSLFFLVSARMEPEEESGATPVRTPAKLDDGDGDANDSGGEEQPNPPDEGDAYWCTSPRAASRGKVNAA